MTSSVPWTRHALFFGIALGGCAVDLGTKQWIFDRLGMPGGDSIWLWRPYFSLATSLNEGALFGWGQGQGMLFSVLSVAAAIGVIYWLFVGGAARDLRLTVALGCVLAGIFGNLYDRLGLPALKWNALMSNHKSGESVYAVRDWLHFQIPGWVDWPVFNIADSLLVCGASMLVWCAFRAEIAVPQPGAEVPADESLDAR